MSWKTTSLLACLASALLASCGSKSGTPPAAPVGVAAAASDGAVTVSWESSTDATGYRVYYGAASAGPLTTSSLTVDAGAALFVSVSGLVDGTSYRFAVAARGLWGESGLSAEATATPQSSAPLAVASTVPADGASAVHRQAGISLVFNRSASAASITGQSSAGACSGSVQLSRDGFATCAALGTPASDANTQSFSFALPAPLDGSATYALRVTTAVRTTGGIALAQTFTQAQGFTTVPALAVASVSPADGATQVPRSSPIVVAFNRPLTAASATFSSSGTACTGALQLSQDGFAADSCLAIASAQVSGTNVTLTPAAPLPSGALIQLRIDTSLLDDTGLPLPAAFTSAGFTARAALAVVSTQPANGQTGVTLNTRVQVVFNQPIGAASIQTSCGSSIRLIAQGHQDCVELASAELSSDGTSVSLTPASPLAASSAYQLFITTGTLDATGAPLPAAVEADFTTGTSTDTTPPGDVQALSVSPALQSLSLSWTAPTDADFALSRVYLCSSSSTCDPKASASVAQLPGAPGAAVKTQLTGLAPQTAFRLVVTAVDQSGNESAGVNASATTAFSGSAADFTSGQTALGATTSATGASFAFTWDTNHLYASLGSADGGSLLAPGQDALWIAVDTDPAVDATGEARTPTVGSNEILWPFLADYVIQLLPDGLATRVQIRAAGGCALVHQPPTSPASSDCPALASAADYDGASSGGPSELSVPASALGSPARVRLAFAAVNTSNGDVYALAPQNPQAIDVLGYFASATASFNPGSNLWTPSASAQAAQPAVSPLSPAAALVTLSVQSAQVPSLKGSLHPLSYTLSDVSFALRDDGTGGDVTAGDGIYSGAFNFGGSAQELFFKFSLGGTDEFPAGSDRIWTLSGAAESLPALAYGTSYSASHSFSLTFAVADPGGTSAQKEVLGNVAELGSFTAGDGAPLTDGGNGTWSTAPVAFANHDFILTPLQFKAHDKGSDTWEADWPGGPVPNHEMNDDVLNRRTLSWTWSQYSNDPQ